MPRFGVLIGKIQFVWTEQLSEQAILKRHAKQHAEKTVGVAFVSLAGVSFVGFLFLFFLQGFELATVLSSAFWLQANTSATFFFISVFFVLLCLSHAVQIRTIKQAIPKRVLGQGIPLVSAFDPQSTHIDVSEVLDPASVEMIDQAYALAKKFGHQEVEPLHLFISSLADDNASAVLARLQIQIDRIKDPLGRRLATRQIGSESVLSETSEQVILEAFINAYEQGRRVVNPFEIFFESYLHDPFIQELFDEQTVSLTQFSNMVAWIRIHEKMREQYELFRQAAILKPTGAMNRSMTSIATPTLDAFSEDLTTAAVQGRTGLLVGREKELEEIFRILQGGRQSALLVGPDGVGKRAILEGIAALMVEERVPETFQDKRLVRVSISHLISGARPEESQERLMSILYEAVRSGNILLVFLGLDQLPDELSTVLVDFLSTGGACSIATTTQQGYTTSIERSVLGRVFEKVNVSEPESDAAIQIVESKILGIEYTHSVSFSYQAIEAMVKLSDRFMHEKYLPKKAIEVAQEVAVMVAKERGSEAVVSVGDVERVISQKTGVPTLSVGQEEKDTLLHLEERMHGRIVGQDEAVSALASALRRARAQMGSGKRPIASFLFLGPTGVGKTELAKTVAQSYFGKEDSLIRLDMSEYQQAESLSRLIGRPGISEGGILTEAIRQQPFALLLLDEFEKAHSDILNVFLQVFDDGRLTDTAGRTIDFTSTIIIATSNAGSLFIQDAILKHTPIEQIKTALLEQELSSFFSPELLNRFDGLILFKPLTPIEIFEITKRLMGSMSEKLEAKGIHFRATDEVVQSLAKKGFDPTFGARPLRRLVQEEVDNAIAKALLEGEVKRRDTIVLKEGGIRIEKGETL